MCTWFMLGTPLSFSEGGYSEDACVVLKDAEFFLYDAVATLLLVVLRCTREDVQRLEEI